jgi:hypothetical protein
VATRSGAPNTPPNGPPPSNPQSSPNTVHFDPKLVAPSQTIYFQRNDQITLILLSNTPNMLVRFNYRWLTPDGEIKEGEFDTQPFSVLSSFAIPLYEGWLLSFNARAVSGLINGQWVFLQVVLNRNQAGVAGLPAYSNIWQGYVYNGGNNGWPGTPAKEITDGPGVIRSITGGAPAAGAQILETMPANTRRVLLSLRAVLVTSAAVANRVASFKITDGANILYTIGNNGNQLAATSFTYHMAPGSQFYNDTQGNIVFPFPTLVELKAGFRIQSLVTGMDVADQWGAPQYEVLEWGLWDA